MHELPVVLDIIQVMDREAAKNAFHEITQIHLVIGELSSIIGESVQMYFEAVAKGHPCENAKLTFEFVPATLKCQSCGHEFPHQRAFECPLCGGDSMLVKGTGHEFYIRSFEGH